VELVLRKKMDAADERDPVGKAQEWNAAADKIL
jgi:hypothetical protein